MPEQRQSKTDKPTEDELLGWSRIIMGEISSTVEPIVCARCGADGERNRVSDRITTGWLRLMRQHPQLVQSDTFYYCSLDCLGTAISTGDLD